MVLGHDSGFRLKGWNYLKALFYSWNSISGYGEDWAVNKGFLITQLPEVLLTELTGSLNTAQEITFVFWFFAIGLSMYVFISAFFKDKKFWIFRVFSSIFYMYNFFLLQAWFIGERAKFSLYVALPLALLIIYKTLGKRYSVIKGTILFSFLFFFFNGGGSPPVYGSILIGSFLVFFYLTVVNVARNGFREIIYSLKTGLSFLFGFILINFYWILPQIYLFRNIYSSELLSVGGIEGALVWESMVGKFASTINLLRLQGIPDWYGGVHPFSGDFTTNPFLIILSFVPMALIVLGLVFHKKLKREEKNDRLVYLVFLALLVGIIFTAGSHPPLGFIYLFFVKHVPGFAIFRTAFYKFATLTWFAVIFLSGYYLNFLLLKFVKSEKLTNLVGVFFVLFILLYHSPFFTADFFKWNPPFTTRVKVPEYVYEISDYINENTDSSSRILLAPKLASHFSSDGYEWGYWSLDVLPKIIINRSILSDDTGHWALVQEIYDALDNKDEQKFLVYTSRAGVNKVLWRDDVLFDNKKLSSEDVYHLEDTLKSFKNVQLEKETSKWRLYNIDTEYTQELVSSIDKIDLISAPGGSDADLFFLGKELNDDPSNLVYKSSLFSTKELSSYVGREIVEASCVYCTPGSFTKFEDDLSIPYVNYLPDSILYPLVLFKEKRAFSGFKDLPTSRIDADLAFANKRVAEISQMIQRPPKENKDETFLQTIDRYKNHLEDISSQLKLLPEISQNEYKIRILVYLKTQEKRFRYLEIKENVLPEAFNDLNKYLNEKIDGLSSNIWISNSEIVRRYYVQLEEDGEFDIEVFNYPREPLRLEVDGRKIDNLKNVSLTSGIHKIELVFSEPENQLTGTGDIFKDITNKDKGEKLTVNIKNYDYRKRYRISFDFLALRGSAPKFIIYQDTDTYAAGEREGIKGELKESSVWRNFETVFTPNFGAKEAQVGFTFQEFNDFVKRGYFSVDNIRITETSNPRVFLVKQKEEGVLSAPKVDFELKDPTIVELSLQGSDRPFVLTLLNSYNPGWRLYDFSAGEDLSTVDLSRKIFLGKETDYDLHFQLNDYANSWLLSKDTDSSLVIVYWPQFLFYIGLVVSGLTVTAFLVLLVGEFYVRKS